MGSVRKMEWEVEEAGRPGGGERREEEEVLTDCLKALQGCEKEMEEAQKVLRAGLINLDSRRWPGFLFYESKCGDGTRMVMVMVTIMMVIMMMITTTTMMEMSERVV